MASPENGGALPNLIIIGAQKCGTTSLHSYLSKHPEVSMSEPKELNFFIDRPAPHSTWDNGVDWYKARFDASKKVRGDASPNYTASPAFPGVAPRMAELVPDAKLIFMVRDPIKRMRSQWIHNYARRNTSKPMREALLTSPIYVSRSRYMEQLNHFLEFYPRERILILEQGELLHERKETLVRVFDFLEIDNTFWHPHFSEERLKSDGRKRKSWVEEKLGSDRWKDLPDWIRKSRWVKRREFDQPPIPEDLHAELAKRIEDDVARFREFTGRQFRTWSV